MNQLAHAYAVCRGITRSSAKNFYYGFLVLPREKRNALCAVYAFMRHSDDLSDTPGMSLEERRHKLAEWLEALHAVLEGKPTDDPVLMAVADARSKFRIRAELLDDLVHGTEMDLMANEAGQVRYRTFEELKRYCYYVASVVGLVTIQIMGYRDPAAEPLAEQTGLAFQLTNILRDVKEDAALGRVYLPEEDLAQFGLTPEALLHQSNGFSPQSLRPVMELEAGRARQFYAAAEQLLPLIDDDAQPALWTLVTIYRRLLEKIAERQYDVFSERVGLTLGEKLKILWKGFVRRLT